MDAVAARRELVRLADHAADSAARRAAAESEEEGEGEGDAAAEAAEAAEMEEEEKAALELEEYAFLDEVAERRESVRDSDHAADAAARERDEDEYLRERGKVCTATQNE